MKNLFFFFFLFVSGVCQSQLSSIEFKLITTGDEKASVDVFKFYISNIEIQFNDGSTFKELNSYHLIDIEEESTRIVHLNNLPEKGIKGLRFTVGTDSAANVSGALDGDLDPIKGMYWAWNSGYVNFKLEGGYKNHHYEYHIGGYLAPNATARNVQFDINKTSKKPIVVNVDVLSFLAKTENGKNNSVLIPGANASELADVFSTIFYIHE